MPNPTAQDPFSTFAAELANNLFTVAKILDEHPATGFCRTCRPESARPAIPAPCSLRHLATLALEIRTESERAAAEAASIPTEPLPVVVTS